MQDWKHYLNKDMLKRLEDLQKDDDYLHSSTAQLYPMLMSPFEANTPNSPLPLPKGDLRSNITHNQPRLHSASDSMAFLKEPADFLYRAYADGDINKILWAKERGSCIP